MARLVLPEALGMAAAMYVISPVGILHAEDQHVLGEPAFLPRLGGGDAQRVALLAEQRVAAVAGPDAPDQPLLGEVQDEAPLG